MAITLVANYQKRLGLPAYSSHSFQVSVESEITDLGQVQGEVARLYGLLQDAVDREIQQVGFVPNGDYGEAPHGHSGNGNGAPRHRQANGNGGNGTNGHSNSWSCSDKQRQLIERLLKENGLDWESIEQTAHDRFGAGVRMLNKLQASGLISELLEVCGGNGKGGPR
ncbi:MAG: hypothetical protein ABF384_01255 [Verrucomicrobiales bacterium]